MSQLEKMQPTLKYDWFKTVLQIDVSVEHEMFFALKEDKIFTWHRRHILRPNKIMTRCHWTF